MIRKTGNKSGDSQGDQRGQTNPACAEAVNKFSEIFGSLFWKTLEARSENTPTTLEPPPENMGQKKLKGEL